MDLAGIQYAGEPGSSADCQDAVVRLLQHGDRITAARILSCGGSHGLLLTINVGDVVAVKSGFGSGYLGEGSRTFSYVLQLLDAYGTEIDEYEVADAVMERLDSSSLRMSDLKRLDGARPVRPLSLARLRPRTTLGAPQQGHPMAGVPARDPVCDCGPPTY